MAGRTEFDYHRSALNPFVDLERRHHGHQILPRHSNAGRLGVARFPPVSNAGKVVNGISSSSSSSTTSGEGINTIQLLKLGENRESVPLIKNDLNDQKQRELIQRTGYGLIQKNGQRIYGGPPPNWRGPPPTKGTEIFVGKVPRDLYEWELVPIFEMYGVIYELRLMMDFSGTNRGYLFVRYSNKEEAKLAIKYLNDYEIRPGKKLGVIPSVDNRKLWISGLPKNASSDEILQEMKKLTDGVTNVCLYNSYHDKTKSRGYAFVEYETHRHAALARRKLVPGHNFILGQEIQRVDWAEPEHEVDSDVMSKVKVLFLRNLTMSTTEAEISATFEAISDGQVEKVKKAKDYAFVHFNTREAAEKAYKATKDDFILNKCPVEVTWSKPIDRLTLLQKKQLFKAFHPSKPEVMVEQHGMKPPFPVAVNPNFLPQPLIPTTPATSPGRNKQHLSGNSMTALRPRGAAPKAPSKSLVGTSSDASMLLSTPGIPPIHASNGFNNYNKNEPNFAKVKHDFAALSLDSTYNRRIPPFGGPTSPPANNAGPVFFGDGSGTGVAFRMNAPRPSTLYNATPPPLYYYGSV